MIPVDRSPLKCPARPGLSRPAFGAGLAPIVALMSRFGHVSGIYAFAVMAAIAMGPRKCYAQNVQTYPPIERLRKSQFRVL